MSAAAADRAGARQTDAAVGMAIFLGATAMLFAALLFCYLKPQGLIVVCVGLLAGYWALMTFVPVPGFGHGNFAEGKNLANYLDQKYLPGKKWDKTWDPEGLLSTLPAVASCLLGVFAGLLLQNSRIDDRKKVTWLFASQSID